MHNPFVTPLNGVGLNLSPMGAARSPWWPQTGPCLLGASRGDTSHLESSISVTQALGPPPASQLPTSGSLSVYSSPSSYIHVYLCEAPK